MDGKLDVFKQCALEAQKANCILCCIKRSVASRAREGRIALLLCGGEASSGVLRPGVESSVQERHGPVGAHPKEEHKNGPRDGTPPYEDGLRAAAVQPGEEKALGRAESGLSVSEGGL